MVIQLYFPNTTLCKYEEEHMKSIIVRSKHTPEEKGMLEDFLEWLDKYFPNAMKRNTGEKDD